MENLVDASMIRETLVLKSQIAGSFGSKLTFTLGTTYLTFGTLGFLVGSFTIKKPLLKFPNKRLFITYYLNNMTQNGLRWANNSGGAAFLYCIAGFAVTNFFEEELDFMNNTAKNALAGGVTGALYKCTRGYKAMQISMLMGAALMGSLTYLTDELRDRDLIDFEMRFDL